MSITFSCDQCTQRYTVERHLAGKRIKCKKCGQVLKIPVPRDVATAPSGSNAPIRKPSPPADDRFGLDDLPDVGESDEVAVERPLARRGPARSSGGKPGLFEDKTTKYAMIGGGSVIGVVLLIALILAFTRGGGKPSKVVGVPTDSPALIAARGTLKEGLAALSDLNEATSSIRDEDDARSARPRVKAAVDRLQILADRSMRATKLGKGEKKKFRAEAMAKTEPALEQWKAEAKRLRAIPGVAEQIAPLAGSIRLPE